MKTAITSLLIITGFHCCIAQQYYCPVSSNGGVVSKFEQWFYISDSSVITKTQFRGKLDSASYKRIPGASSDAIYFTDGNIERQLYFLPTTGIVKGFKYEFVASLVPDSRNVSVKAGFYCLIEAR